MTKNTHLSQFPRALPWVVVFCTFGAIDRKAGFAQIFKGCKLRAARIDQRVVPPYASPHHKKLKIVLNGWCFFGMMTRHNLERKPVAMQSKVTRYVLVNDVFVETVEHPRLHATAQIMLVPADPLL
jgi:hypothetical protein